MARRQGGRIVLRDVPPELSDLIELAGLDEVLLQDQDPG
jgi:anti-anti-sigma regulatory factor